MLRLKEMNPEDAREEYACLQELVPENGVYNQFHDMPYEQFVAEGIPLCMANARGEGLRPEHVPETWYLLWDDDRAVALFRVRHHLNDRLRVRGGHIGYAVREGERGKGYATRGLALAAEEAWKLIPEEEIWLSCRRDNPASLRVMLKNGAYICSQDDEECYTRIPRQAKDNGQTID